MTLQGNLFADASPSIQRSAVFDGPGNSYRIALRRTWDAGSIKLVVCMLNPSTADHECDDPTILTLIHFAKLWGYGGLYVVNLFSLRTSSPAVLKWSPERIGSRNDAELAAALDYAWYHGVGVLAAWGNDGALDGRDAWFRQRAAAASVSLVCLGLTKDGHPKHPLARGRHRVPRDMQPLAYSVAA